MRAILVAFLVLVLVGCQGIRPSLSVRGSGRFVMLDPSEDWCREMWMKEAQRRYSNPVLVFGHGGVADGEWCVWISNEECRFPVPVTWVASQVKGHFPDSQVVLMICNPDGMKCNVPGVWYPPSSFWLVPDRDYGPLHRDPDLYVGKIEEFVTD